MLLDDYREKIDYVYGIYLSENGTMLGDKYFDVDTNDFVIVDRIKYKDTLGTLYELIFHFSKEFPTILFIIHKNDKLAYNIILLAMNAHRRSHKADDLIGSKEYKYKNIIAPLVSGTIRQD